ncbi:Uncharacterized protein BM_BM17118 [Brugia malayi]|uniref:Tubulin/FtsZ GTPase domain-containing protein n=1 Tax=Brugia malayi TaxID=6279 RepID=A0A4E9FSV8_BRUMA|nr:Uncharacterized protein BM_BM17118 [Brugia malayi]VIO99953.1 Uncharacterized protein BM_BM17118 [Brugia malayi]
MPVPALAALKTISPEQNLALISWCKVLPSLGGAGGKAVNNMIQSNLQGVNFVVANTDAEALEKSLCDKKIQLGINLTKGLDAGALPDVGKGAAEESMMR